MNVGYPLRTVSVLSSEFDVFSKTNQEHPSTAIFLRSHACLDYIFTSHATFLASYFLSLDD